MNKLVSYLGNVAVAYDEFWNTVFGGNPHETISRRAYRATFKKRAWACVLCQFLNIFQRNHCEKSAIMKVPPLPDIEK